MESVPYTQDTSHADSYVLDRTYSAASRLNLQHYLWTDALGYVLHPSIPRPQPGQRIADVATGTGVWLFDLERQLPAGVQYDGLDISLDQVPPDTWLPPKTAMRQWDMLDPVPEDLVGQFDVVHVRLILLVVLDNNPVPVIDNLRKLLKPGGYLQWEELHNIAGTLAKADGEGASVPGAPTDAGHPELSAGTGSDYPPCMRQIQVSMADRSKLGWSETLHLTLNDHGFEGAVRHRYTDRLAMLKPNNQMLLVFCEEMLANIAKMKGAEAAKGWRQLVAGADAESKQGWVFYVPKFVYVARKT